MICIMDKRAKSQISYADLEAGTAFFFEGGDALYLTTERGYVEIMDGTYYPNSGQPSSLMTQKVIPVDITITIE